jgi:hypothetical protein
MLGRMGWWKLVLVMLVEEYFFVHAIRT